MFDDCASRLSAVCFGDYSKVVHGRQEHLQALSKQPMVVHDADPRCHRDFD